MTKLYIISPPEINASFRKALENALSTYKVSCFQLRLKNLPEKEIAKYCQEFSKICRDYGAVFLLNVDLVRIRYDGAAALAPYEGDAMGDDDLNAKCSSSAPGRAPFYP